MVSAMKVIDAPCKKQIFWMTLNPSLVIFVFEKENRKHMKDFDIGKSNTGSDSDLINDSCR